MARYATIDPRTNTVVAEFEETSDADVEEALTASAEAYAAWSDASLDERVALLTAVAVEFRSRIPDFARTVSLEMGKPVTQAEGEAGLAASVFEYYASEGARLLADEELEVPGGRALVRTTGVGPVLGIMPWNFPLYQAGRFIAPNLLLGNTVLLKHSSACPQTAELIADVLHAAGAGDRYLNIRATTAQVATIVADDRVQGVSLTGSERAGRAVGALAGEHLKKCVLELGGSDPFVVLPGADMSAALDAAETGRFLNAGQSCTSAKRMIVHEDVWDQFLDGIVTRAREWRTGDPQDPATKVGPMASVSGRDELGEQVDDAVEKGATVHLGGVVPDGPGAYYPVTVLTGVTPDMRAFGEELFGPVAVVYRVASSEEAIELANATRFGLGSTVFAKDVATAEAIADRIDAGMVGVNTLARSLPNLPFGGVKASGIGRELGRLGLDEFANKKLLRVA